MKTSLTLAVLAGVVTGFLVWVLSVRDWGAAIYGSGLDASIATPSPWLHVSVLTWLIPGLVVAGLVLVMATVAGDALPPTDDAWVAQWQVKQAKRAQR